MGVVATIAAMHSRWRRAAAAIGLALLGLVLAGCDASGSIVVQADETVAVDLVVRASDLGTYQDGSPCPAQINALTITPELTPKGAAGCRITGTVRPTELAPVLSLATMGEYQVLALNVQSEDALPTGQVDVTIRFVGDIVQASDGQVEGNSVRVTSMKELTDLRVIALARPGPPDRVIWGVAGVVGTLLVVGTLWLVLRRRPPATVLPGEPSAEEPGLRPSEEPAMVPTPDELFAPPSAPAAPPVGPAVHDHSIWAPPQDDRPVD